MKLKTVTLDGKTYAELDGDKPIYVHDDGKEIPLDGPALSAQVTRLNGEAMGHRRAKDDAEAKLKGFEGITDAAAARKALETVKNLDDKKLLDAGQVDTIKAEVIKAVEDKYAPVVAERDQLKTDLYGEKIGGAFARSKFIADKIAVPADMVEATFGKAFKIEDGKVVAYDANGSKIFSRSKLGDPADFEEALETLVASYPNKDNILKGTVKPGGGAGNGGANHGGGKTIARAEFNTLSPTEQMNKMTAEGYTVVD